MALYLLKTHNSSTVMRKMSDKSQLGTSYKILDQYSSKLSSLRNGHSQEEPKETWWLNVCDILDEIL